MAANDPQIHKRNASNNGFVEVNGAEDIRAAISAAASGLTDPASQAALSSGDGEVIQGREYLYAFYDRVRARTASKIVMSGDSTTSGENTTTPYRIWEIIPNIAQELGFNGITAVDRGVSGAGTAAWLSTYLALDLAENPDLMTIRWGLNDPNSVRGDQGNADYTIANIRTGLATIRASRTVAQTAIVLMMPNSCTDDAAYRTTGYFRALRIGLQQAARDYQCALFDTYQLLRDSSFGGWINEDYFTGSGRYVHPLNIGNMMIAGALTELLFPRSLCLSAQSAGIENTVHPTGTKVGSDLPSVYRNGVSILPALTTGSGTVFPYQGYVITHKHASGYATQTNILGFASPSGQPGARGYMAMRHGYDGAGWSAWHYFGYGDVPATAPAALTLQNSWANFGSGSGNAQYERGADGIVRLSGLVKDGTFTPYGATTVITTLPSGFRPASTRWFTVPNAASFADGAQLFATVIVNTNGTVQIYKANGNYYLALDQIQFSTRT